MEINNNNSNKKKIKKQDNCKRILLAIFHGKLRLAKISITSGFGYSARVFAYAISYTREVKILILFLFLYKFTNYTCWSLGDYSTFFTIQF